MTEPSITQIELYENTVREGMFRGQPSPSMTVKGDGPVEELEADVIEAYQAVVPNGKLVDLDDCGRYLSSHPRALSTDFAIGRTFDGAIDLQRSSPGDVRPYLVEMVKQLQEKHPTLTVNDKPGYLA